MSSEKRRRREIRNTTQAIPPERPKSQPVPPQIAKQRSMTRAQIIALLSLLFIAGTGTGVYVLNTKDNPGKSSTSTSQPAQNGDSSHANAETQEEKESRFFRLIEKVEAAMKKFENRINFENIQDQHFKRDLETLFGFIGKNKIENPKRNAALLRRDKDIEIKPTEFFYSFFKSDPQQGMFTVASFNVPMRTLSVSEDFEAEDTIDQLAVVHENVHAADDAIMRIGYLDGVLPQYEKVLQGRLLFNSEIKAFAYQIMLLDSLLNGFLKSQVSVGTRIDTPEAVAQISAMLGLEKSSHSGRSRAFLSDLLMDAQVFFATGGITNESVSREFYETIYEKYKGTALVIYKGNGEITELNAENYGKLIGQGRRILR